jgi:hypothetical protein
MIDGFLTVCIAREATAKEGLELQENKAAKEDSSIFSFGNDLVDGKLG